VPGKRREGLPLVTERRERENSAASRVRDGRTGAMDLVGGTSSNPGMPRRVRTPNLRPNHREVRCAEPVAATAAAAAAATAASTPTVRDRSGCASTTPGFGGSVASPPSPRCPFFTCGRARRALAPRFEALVRRFVRLGESTCSTASRVRSAARCLCRGGDEIYDWNESWLRYYLERGCVGTDDVRRALPRK